MAYSSDEQYNSATRHITCKIIIQLVAEIEPLVLTGDKDIIDWRLLEEASSGNLPFDGASSNELSVTLYSPNGIYDPANTVGEYAGLLKRGVPVTLYVRAAETDDWYQLFSGKVSSWSGQRTTQKASFIANDILYGLFDKEDIPVYRPQEKMHVATFWQQLLNPLKITPTIDSTINGTLPFAYVRNTYKDTIKQLCIAFLGICNVAHDGLLHVRPLASTAPQRFLRDSEQVVSINSNSSDSSAFDASHLTYYLPKVSDETELFSDGGYEVLPNENIITCELKEAPLWSFESIRLQNTTAQLSITKVESDAHNVYITVDSAEGIAARASLAVNGRYIQSTKKVLGEEKDNTLKLDSLYIQNATQAEKVKAAMDQLVALQMPTLSLKIRGNPNIEIGDRVIINSPRYEIAYQGVVLRQSFSYSGSLSCDLTVLDEAIIKR